MRVQFHQIAGHRIRLLTEGDGSSLLMIHGVGTMAERWNSNIDALAASCRVVAPDLMWCGFSDDVPFGDGAPQLIHLTYLEKLLAALSIDKFSVVGSSYGGLLAALLALRHPSSVEKLVIVGSGSALHPADEQRKVLVAARLNALTALEDGTPAGLYRRFSNIVYDVASVSDTAIALQLTANALPGRKQASLAFYDQVIAALNDPAAQAYGRLETIKTPTLIITGRDDPRASWRRAEEARQRIADARLIVVEKCGHGPMFEHADLFNAAISAFLAGRDLKSFGAV